MNPSDESPPRTTFITVLMTEEVPVLSEAERSAVMDSLAEAEADAEAERGALFKPETFVDEMMARCARFTTRNAV